jgi:ABC-2 type transport system ATP-binding protein
MHRPELLILDEPTSGLDPLMQEAFNELVRGTADDGRTVFLSSHVLPEVQHVAVSGGAGAFALYQFDRREVLRYTMRDRVRAYRRLFGYGSGPGPGDRAARRRHRLLGAGRDRSVAENARATMSSHRQPRG